MVMRTIMDSPEDKDKSTPKDIFQIEKITCQEEADGPSKEWKRN